MEMMAPRFSGALLGSAPEPHPTHLAHSTPSLSSARGLCVPRAPSHGCGHCSLDWGPPLPQQMGSQAALHPQQAWASTAGAPIPFPGAPGSRHPSDGPWVPWDRQLVRQGWKAGLGAC